MCPVLLALADACSSTYQHIYSCKTSERRYRLAMASNRHSFRAEINYGDLGHFGGIIQFLQSVYECSDSLRRDSSGFVPTLHTRRISPTVVRFGLFPPFASPLTRTSITISFRFRIETRNRRFDVDECVHRLILFAPPILLKIHDLLDLHQNQRSIS